MALLAPTVARAHEDPAGDILIDQDVFVPFTGGAPAESKAQLLAIVRQARVRGYHLKVAVIARKDDLGPVPRLFDRPQQYARFLGREISFAFRGPVLVVMPAGYGVFSAASATVAGQRELARLGAPAAEGTDVTTAAAVGVERLAAAAGVRLTVTPVELAQSESGSDRLKIVAGTAIAVALALAPGLARRRSRPSRRASG